MHREGNSYPPTLPSSLQANRKESKNYIACYNHDRYQWNVQCRDHLSQSAQAILRMRGTLLYLGGVFLLKMRSTCSIGVGNVEVMNIRSVQMR
ncbi:IS3 family transposase [Rossellomorea marisflavi]|uniref:IS3 family transposase n=1 Tax=Rossellomorea marisflavi TaxID=189381 RepID=UPI00345A1101